MKRSLSEDNLITVSVILPVYNVAPWIGECIESLKKQKLPGLEFIFVDDCSDDGSEKIIERFAGEDRRVRILYNEENRGAGYTRNRGIEAARGEYLSFIDPDDWISEDFYSILYSKAAGTSFDIVKGSRIYVPEGSSPCEGIPSDLNKKIIRNKKKDMELFISFTYEHQSAIYRSTLFQDETVRYGASRNAQDSTFLLKICSVAGNIEVVEGPVYY